MDPLDHAIVAAQPAPRRLRPRTLSVRSAGRAVEALLLAAGAGAVSVEAFFLPHAALHGHEYLLVPLAGWAALRFGVCGAAAVACALAGLALLGASFGLGEFGGGSGRGLFEALLFVGTVGTTSIVFAVVIGESRRAHREAEASAASAREVGEELERFMRYAPLPVFVRDPAGRFLAVSHAYGELLGRGPHEIVGRSVEDVWGREFAVTLRRDDERALASGEVVRSETEHQGRTFLSTRFRLGSGDRARVGGYVTDVTERQQAERALRLASVGALASGVAHEVNNPLSFLTSNLAFLADELGTLERDVAPGRVTELRDAVDEALHGAQRVRRIVRDLHQVSARQREAAHPFDPGAAVETALDLVRGRIRAHGDLEENLAPTPLVLGSEAELSEALVNVLVNAVDAILPCRSERHRIRVCTATDGEARAVIEVSDTGRGIAGDELPRIFDAFYTTKEPGSGAGLGLAVAHGIVTRMGGDIEVRSAPGAGTTVRIVLLPAPARRGEVSDGGAPAAPLRRSARAEGRA